MATAIDQLLTAARAHEADFAGPQAGIPTMQIAVVTCMDARIDTARLFGLDAGRAHVIRNAGGLVTDDVLRSLVLSQRKLGTREVLLMQHTSCGMHHLDEAPLRAEITAEAGSSPPYAFGGFSDLDESVRQAIRHLRAYPYLPHRDGIRGFVYDVDTGSIREIQP